MEKYEGLKDEPRPGNGERMKEAVICRCVVNSKGRLPLLLLAFAVLTALPSPLLSQRAGAPGLGVDGLPLSRQPGSVAVLALATGRWQAVSSRSEELLGDFRYLPEYASARAQGQVFRVVKTDGPKLLPDRGGAFVVVPWSFGPGCAEEGWQTPEWVTPGDTVAFLLVPTRAGGRGGTGDGQVFDVLGWHQPYPVGELIPFWRKTRDPSPSWLPTADFYHLLTLLPSETALETRPGMALEAVGGWLGASPDRGSAFPVREMLAEWRERWGAEVRSDNGNPEGEHRRTQR